MHTDDRFFFCEQHRASSQSRASFKSYGSFKQHDISEINVLFSIRLMDQKKILLDRINEIRDEPMRL